MDDEAEKFDLILKSGRGVNIDLDAISLSELEGLVDASQKEHDAKETIARLTGLTVTEINDRTQVTAMDYKKILRVLFKKWNQPLTDPN